MGGGKRIVMQPIGSGDPRHDTLTADSQLGPLMNECQYTRLAPFYL